MIEQNVQVVRCQDERLWVRMGSQSGCTACDNGNGCGAGLFAKLLQRKPVVLELARNDMSVKPGQMLTLAFPERVYMKLILAFYAWPLLAALSGAFAGHWLGTTLQWDALLIDAGTLFGGLLAGGLVMRLVKTSNMADTVLRSLSTMVYYPSGNPNMCDREPLDSV
jgi:sigma-E factor negative regulatory protein RseC